MERKFILLGAAILFFGVALGAFGAHSLEGYFEQYPSYESTFETAVQYQVWHGLGLFAVAYVAGKYPSKLVNRGGWLLFMGVLLFSGSLYLLVATRISMLGAITPLGGIAFLSGWLLIFWSVWRQ